MIGEVWLIATAAVAATASDTGVVLATLTGEEFSSSGISGEIVKRPAGITDEEYARRLMETEGLKPWTGFPFLSLPGDGLMGTAAIIAANGQEINIKYVVDDPARVGRVCRLRFSPGVGAAQVRWEAYRWCASAFGLSLPASFPPPIRTVEE